MPWSDFNAALQFYTPGAWNTNPLVDAAVSPLSPAEEQQIRNALLNLYQNSPVAAQMLDAAASLGPIRIGKSNPNNPGFHQDAGGGIVNYFGLNPGEIEKVYWFNQQGMLVKADLDIVIAHEFAHYVYGNSYDDPKHDLAAMNGASFDFDGNTVRMQNEVAIDLSRLEDTRVSYHAVLDSNSPFDGRFAKFTVGENYTGGADIDIVRIGDFDGPNDTLDLSHRTDDSRDLMFGLTGHDVLKGGGGQDFLYGGDDSDELQGGNGDDKLYGEAGDDVLSGGLGSDLIDGGEGDDVLDYGLENGGVPASFALNASGTQQGDLRARYQLTNGGDTDTLVGVESIKLTDQSDQVRLLGDLDQYKDAPVIDMRGGAAAFHQDEVVASQSTTGIYFNLGSGKAVGLDQTTDRGLLGWAASLVGVGFEKTDVQINGANSAIGTAYSDALIASSGERNSGEGYSTLYGEGGNDLLVGGGWESHLYGGSGEDRFEIRANTHVEDGETHDIASYGGIPLFGGVKQWWMEGNTAYWSPFSTLLTAFPVVGSSLLMTAAFFIDVASMKFARYKLDGDGNLLIDLWGQTAPGVVHDYHLDLDSGVGTAGITVFEAGVGDGSGASLARIGQFVNLALKAGFGIGLGGFDPLVLDLDGDGYELTTEGNSQAFFEFDDDGFGERTGWVRGDDGLLALDTNANGMIDNVTELFGNRTTSGFTALAVHDANADGKIDAADSIYGSLRVWRDLDQDGVSDSGELKTLAELGVVSISLASATPAEPTAVGGNAIVRTGSFTRADGSTRGIADVAFQINETASRWLGDNSVSPSAAALPQLKGFGELKDLHVAMTGNAALESLVADFAALTTNDLGILKTEAEAILYAWAGVGNVAADPIGASGFDARKLAFLEKYSGYALMPRDAEGDVQTTNLPEMEALWADQVTRLTLRLIVQGPMADAFSSISYREDLDLLVANTPTALADLYAGLLTDLSADPTQALAQWQSWAPLLGAMADGMRRADANLVRADFIGAQLLRAMDGVAQPLDFAALAGGLGLGNIRVGADANDTLSRNGASDTVIYVGGGGTDTLNGGGGQDVYVFGHEIGNATINDIEASPSGDRIRFTSLNPDDVKLTRQGNDLLVTVTATGETVRVTGQFAPVVPLSSDVLLSTNKGVEEIQFANGAVFEMPEIMSAVGTGTDANDHMVGTMHSDVLLGGLGDDRLEGGDDADLYVVNGGEGHDVIHDVQSTVLLRAADVLVFGDDIAPDGLIFSRAGSGGDDLLITIGTGGQSVLIEGQFGYSSLGYNDKFALNSRIEAFAFREYGEGWSNKDIQQLLIGQATTAGADETLGFGDEDAFGASAGDDVLVGMDGADTYVWSAGAGNDRIDERARYIDVSVGLGGISLTVRADRLQFDASIDPATLVFSRPYDSLDLVITNSATGETMTIIGQFDSFQTGVLGAQWFDRVEWFEFANGVRLSWKDVTAIVTTGGDGDDRLRGDILEDELIGGRGNDLLSGGGGGDTYVFNLGDGHDTVFDDNRTLIGDGFLTVDQTIDKVQLGAGIGVADITFGRSGFSVTLMVGASGDAITLRGQDDYIQTGVFGAIPTSRIEEVRFHEGTVWTWQEVNRRMIAAQTTAGDDVTLGFTLSDRFEKSAGNDLLRGGESGDTYVFGFGSGHDRIEESVSNVLYGDDDVVVFDTPVLPEDVLLSRNGNDLILTLLSSGDTLTVAGQFAYSAWYTWNDVELFRFANGVEWTKSDVQVRLLTPTAGDDHLIGFDSGDELNGGAGDDVLEGRNGGDIYYFGRGSGHDTVVESLTNSNLGDGDRMVFGPGVLPEDVAYARDGNDLVITIVDTGDSVRIAGQFNFGNWFAWNDVETFAFENGTILSDVQIAARILGGTSDDDHLIGTFRSDTLDGGAGNDILEGGDGSDIYVFGRGYGQDEIRETLTTANLGEDDELRFGPNLTLADLGFARTGNDLIITIKGTTDSVRLVGEFNNSSWFSWNDVERFSFADGSVLARQDIQQILLTGTAGVDHLVGFYDANTLDGGAGDDLLEGWDGADTYVFGRGYGHDYVRETKTDGNLSDDDTVQLQEGIGLADVTLKRDGYNLIIELDTGDTLTVESHFAVGYNEMLTYNDIDRIRFADGTELSKTDILLTVLQGTTGNDILIGAGQTDILDGGAGDDWLQGEEGSDEYVWGVGYGNDVIQERYNLVTRPEQDRLSVHGVLPAELSVSRSGEDMILTLPSGETLTVKGQLHPWGWTDIEEIAFDNGTSWSFADIRAEVLRQQVTPGNDTIEGFAGDDLLLGGAGDDTLHGAEGNDTFGGGAGDDVLYGYSGDDTYRLELGGGNDTVDDYRTGWGSGNDTIEVAEGIHPGDLTVSRVGTDLVLAVTATGESIRIRGGALEAGAVSREVEQVRFSDGTVWNSAYVRDLARIVTAGDDVLMGSNGSETINALAGNDHIEGFDGADTIAGGAGGDWISAGAGADTITGGTGDDTIYGGGDNDVYLFAPGDGADTISEYGEGGGGFDQLVFGAGIASNAVQASLTNNGLSIVLSIAGSTDQITIAMGNAWYTEYRVDQVRFADGTSWSFADVIARASGGTAGNDTLYGSINGETLAGGAGNDWIGARGGNDTLWGGSGNDTLNGGGGDDIYAFDLGDGQDVISEYDESGSGFDQLVFGAGILASDIQVSQANDGRDMVLKIAGTTDQVTIRMGNGWYNEHRVDQIKFADGTSWALADLIARLPTAGNDAIRGSFDGETIAGGAGNDYIRGDSGNDTLSGGTGNDTVYGGGGNDIYQFDLGDGQDVISEYDESGSGFDQLVFGAGILASDIQVSQANDGRDMVLKIAGTTDQVTIRMGNGWYNEHRVDQIKFADGTSWTLADMIARLPTAGNDAIRGSLDSESIAGGAGNDYIRGDSGNDTLSGGTGNDTVYGGGGNDIYLFGLGDGQDVIGEYDESGNGFDQLVFNAGILASDIQASQANSGRDIILKIMGTTDQVTIKMGNGWYNEHRVDEVKFADGTSWNFDELLARSTPGAFASSSYSGETVSEVYWADDVGSAAFDYQGYPSGPSWTWYDDVMANAAGFSGKSVRSNDAGLDYESSPEMSDWVREQADFANMNNGTGDLAHGHPLEMTSIWSERASTIAGYQFERMIAEEDGQYIGMPSLHLL